MLQSSVAGRAPRPTAPVFNARTLKLRQHSRLYAHGKAGDEAPAGQDTPGLEHALQTFTSQFATLTTELKSLKKIVATKNDVHRLEDVSKGRKQLELALRTLERAALLARKPKPRQITLTGHVYVANMDEREELSSKATYDKNLVILVHKG